MKINMQKERIFIDIALFLCIFLLPSYVSIAISALFMIRYQKYIEFPIFALVIDVLYKTHGYAYIGLFGWSLLILVLVELLRGNIKMKGRDTL